MPPKLYPTDMSLKVEWIIIKSIMKDMVTLPDET